MDYMLQRAPTSASACLLLSRVQMFQSIVRAAADYRRAAADYRRAAADYRRAADARVLLFPLFRRREGGGRFGCVGQWRAAAEQRKDSER